MQNALCAFRNEQYPWAGRWPAGVRIPHLSRGLYLGFEPTRISRKEQKAEGVGFEPTARENPCNGLAGRPIQPL